MVLGVSRLVLKTIETLVIHRCEHFQDFENKNPYYSKLVDSNFLFFP